MNVTREEVEARIASEQARLDEMKRRRMRKRPDGTEVQVHGGYDDEIAEVEDALQALRASLAARWPDAVPGVRIFVRPPIKQPRLPNGTPNDLPGIVVERIGQTVRNVGGRARVFDDYALVMEGTQMLTGTRREVMYQASLAAALDTMGELPRYLREDIWPRLRRRLLRGRQFENRRLRRKSRRVRKACKMLARVLVSKSDFMSEAIRRAAGR